MSVPVVADLEDVVLDYRVKGERFEAWQAQLGALLGARLIGCALLPGKAAWPFHCPQENEGMYVVLTAMGTLRYGTARLTLLARDLVVARQKHYISGRRPLRVARLDSAETHATFIARLRKQHRRKS